MASGDHTLVRALNSVHDEALRCGRQQERVAIVSFLRKNLNPALDLPVPKVVSQATSTSGVPLLNGKPLKIQDKREK